MDGFEVTKINTGKWVIFHWNVRCGMKEYRFKITAIFRAIAYRIEDMLL
jgi:hypothetical protein